MDRPKGRLTVVETVYHQSGDRDPVSTDSRFWCELATREQVYQRHLQVPKEWIPLDCGWLENNVSMLTIQNDEGQFLQTNPSEEELQAIAKKIIEVRYTNAEGCWEILPGQSMRARPSETTQLIIRCQSGYAEITLTLFPK